MNLEPQHAPAYTLFPASPRLCSCPAACVIMVHATQNGCDHLKSTIKRALRSLRRTSHHGPAAPQAIPDAELYRPLYSPWFSAEFERYYRLADRRSLVSRDRCYVLYSLARQAAHATGDFWECGVYKGGTAAMLAALLRDIAPSRKLHLFDTFQGMPETDAGKDVHRKGDFSDTSLSKVKAYLGGDERVIFHPGLIPATFAGLESERIAFAHIDVDIYKSIIDSLDFIWPRLSSGGVVVFDDYGFPTCPGARQAVDTFFAQKPEVPLCLSTGQAIVWRL